MRGERMESRARSETSGPGRVLGLVAAVVLVGGCNEELRVPELAPVVDEGIAAPSVPGVGADDEIVRPGDEPDDGAVGTEPEPVDPRPVEPRPVDPPVEPNPEPLPIAPEGLVEPGCRVEGASAAADAWLDVEPLDTLLCDAGGDGAGIAAYRWVVVDRPEGSTATFDPPDRAQTRFFVDLAGEYLFELEVLGEDGVRAVAGQQVKIRSVPGSDLHVQLVWHTPNDPAETDIGFGAGTDVDLHMLRRGFGCWEDTAWDCHFRAREPAWGDNGHGPTLDIDDTDGAGPENINYELGEGDAETFLVGVHYYNDHGYGPSFATVRIYLFGTLTFEARDIELEYTDRWWVVAAVHLPSLEITAVDLQYDDVPPCR